MKTLKYLIALWVCLLAYKQNTYSQCAVVPPVPQDACWQQTILIDPYCCNIAWDALCQLEYDSFGCTGAPVGCSVVAPVPDDPCYQMVIYNDPNCCNVAWDAACQQTYDGCSYVDYNFNGGTQNWVVPTCVSEIFIQAAGAQGGSAPGTAGGDGAIVSYTVPVTAGDVIGMTIGGQGGCPGAGFNGGGIGWNSADLNPNYGSCGGGGSTDIYVNGTLTSISGAGGGAGGGSVTNNVGGDGGCVTGSQGGNTFGEGGYGGTQTNGGADGYPWIGTIGAPDPTPGSSGQGGNGGFWNTAPGGGGGGGYFGGGGGGHDGCCTGGNGGGGGGGGSSLVPGGGGCTDGANQGDGWVSIAWGCETVLPTASNPAPIAVQCPGDVPAPNVNVVTDEADNCDPNPTVAFVGDVSDGNTCPETITRTYSITDACFNVATVTQTITIMDTQNPVFAVPPGNITVDCIGNVPAMTNLNWTDNCDGAGAVAGVDGGLVGGTCGGTITRTWTYTDACGNTATATQVITVDDNQAPVFAAPPANVSVQCPADVPAMTNLSWTDNCDGAGSVMGTDASNGNTCPEIITRTWTYTDACGNTSTETQTITVNDTQAPVFAAPPANTNVQCPADVPAMTNLNWTDNCDGAGTVTGTDVSDGNTCPEIITRTWTYTDACGNTSTETQTITVNDTQAPVFAAPPANTSVQCAADVPAMTNLNWTDNCDGAGTVTGTDVSDGNTCPEIITRTWTYTDACGNTSTETQAITVNDTQAPVFAAPPANITVECVGDVPAMTNLNWTDNCDGAGSVAGVDGALVGGSCGGTITRTWTYTDACGNTTTETQTITIDDTTPPTASNPPNINIVQGNPVPGSDPLVVTDEADNCDPNPTVVWVSDVSDNQNCPETITRTYSITDACGNQTTVTQLIIIGDAILPTASNPAPINVECIADIPAPDPLVVTDEADNGGPPVVAWDNDASDGNTCPETITRTYSVTDDCGNVIYVTQTITVMDVTAPVMAAPPANVTVQCIGDVPPMTNLNWTDNCDGNGSVTGVDASDGNTCPETITRTWTYTDACGNTSTETQTIIVDDTTPPLGTAPANVTVECIGDVPPANTALVTGVSDNCTANPTVNFVGDASDGNTCPETITRTYEIVDACGNTTAVTQDIIVDDTTLPTASNPATTTIPGGPAPAPDPAVVIDEADNCTANPVVAFVSQVSDGNPCPETITYTYSVTDDCGNSINVTHDVLITDPIMPTGTAPANITVECIGDVPPADPLLITDEADNNGVPTVTHAGDVSDGNTCPETITRTYDITDVCGNVTSVTQTIIVDDTTPPTASNPAGVNVECIGDVPAPDINVVTDEADNCTVNPIVAHVGDFSDGNTCPETITRAYSITDDCGNQITVNQIIVVDDVTPPLGTAPANVTVECIGDVPPANTALVTGVSDNCTANPTVNFVGDASDGNTCPETITRTYEIVDACGNTTTVTQDIIVDDTTLPTASNPATTTIPGGPAPAPDPAVVIDEADNCTANPVVAFVSQVSDGNPCPETITYTYSVTDDCGNSINVTHDVLITDPIMPTGTAPANITVECIGDVPAPDPLLITDEADNQPTPPTVAFVSDVSDGNTCPETITRTYSITDVCGNQILVTQTITVDDTTLPTASNPVPIAVQCIGDVPAPDPNVVIDEADNCTANPVVTFVSDISDGNTCPETITRTYSVTDDCGNAITVSQLITVDDTVDPTASNPATVIVECIADVPAPDPTVVIDEADNCTVNPIVLHAGDVSDGNTCPETITRTYSVTDNCNNQILVTQTIIVHDITNPTASNPPTINVNCASDVPLPDPAVVTDEADNCTANPTVTHVSDVSDGNICNGETITRTYAVADDCGNQITVTQTIVIDVVTPTVDAGQDVAVCDGTPVTLTATNSPGSTITWSGGISDGTAFNQPVGTNTYTVVASACGNECFIQDDVDVTVNPNPVVSFMGDTLIGCEPHTVNFTNTSTEQGTCQWDFGNGSLVTGCSGISGYYGDAGTFDVTLTVTSPFGCTSTDTYPSYVEVVPFPEAMFSFNPNEVIITDTEVEFINNSSNADFYNWDFGDNGISQDENPTHVYPEVSGDYMVTLTAYSNVGCYDEVTALLTIKDELIWYVPNVFTPDGNGFNDGFKPIITAGVDYYDYHLTIFNRWGEIVFESYNYDYGWDGHYGDGGLVEDGVYIWQIEFGDTMSDKKHKHRGHVTVLK